MYCWMERLHQRLINEWKDFASIESGRFNADKTIDGGMFYPAIHWFGHFRTAKGRNRIGSLPVHISAINSTEKAPIVSLHTQRIFFQILLNQPKIRLYLPCINLFGNKRTFVWFKINRKMVNTIWFRVDLIRFRKDFSVCIFTPADWKKIRLN